MDDLNAENKIINDLNRSFYGDFDSDYFEQKITYLLALLADPDFIGEKKGGVIEYGKLKIQDLSVNEDKLKKNIQTEIALTYYHAVETLFRLLLAHGENTDCPWIEIASLTSFKKFKEQIKENILDRKLSLNGKTFEESLAVLFFGGDLSEKVGIEKWKSNDKNLNELLAHFAKDLLHTPHYNSYKHGLAIFPSQLGLNFGELIDVDREDTLMFLEIKKDGKRKYISKTHHFLRWDEKFAQVYIVNVLIKNLVAVGRMRFCNDGKESESWLSFVDEFDLNKIITTKNGIVIDSCSERLGELRDKEV